jgi:hypothetical protein
MEFDACLTNLASYINYFERALECIAYFCGGIAKSASSLFVSSETHLSLFRELEKSEENCGKKFTEAVRDTQSAHVKGFYTEIYEMQKSVADVRNMRTEREKLRLIYDHYTQKVASLTKVLEKKRASNPMYVDNPKKVEKMARVLPRQNERKLRSATDNYQSHSSKCMANINQLMDSTYTRVAPIIAKVLDRQLVSLQMSLFMKSAQEMSLISEVPQSILEANKRVMASIERERYDQADRQQESQRLSLQSNAPKPAEVRSSLPPMSASQPRSAPQPKLAASQPKSASQPQVVEAIETDEDFVFDMKKLDRLTGKDPGITALRTDPLREDQAATWEEAAKPVQSRASYWDRPAATQEMSPSTDDSFSFATGMPRQSAPQRMERSQSVAQINTSRPQQESQFGSDIGQMAQMQQWMSMMMSNPEAVAQMQQMQQSMMMAQMQSQRPPLDPNDPFYTLESDPEALSGSKAPDPIFGGFGFAPAAFDQADVSQRGESVRQSASRNPFADEKGFFNL